MVFVEENIWASYLHLERVMKILVQMFWKESKQSKFHE